MSTPQLRRSRVGTTCVVVVLLHLTLHSAVVQGFGINLMQVPSEDKSQPACTMALLQKYFNSGDSLAGAVLCVSITPYSRDVQDQLLQAFNLHPDYPWTILATNTKAKPNVQAMQEKPQCYFLVVDNLDDEDLDEILGNWKRMHNWNPLAQFVVYLASIEETDEEMTDLMVEILLSFMNNKIYNVNVIGQSDENSFYYGKTVFPYQPDNNCGNRVIAIELLDACSYEDAEQTEADDSSDYDDEEETNLDDEIESEVSEGNDEEAETEIMNDDDPPSENEENENGMEERDDEEGTTITDSINEDRKDNNTQTYMSLVIKNEKQSLESKNSNATKQPEISIEEYVRARFEDKFPRDLSGCPLRAAYRGPWEPYIFTISQTAESEYDEAIAAAGNESIPSYEGGDVEVEEDYSFSANDNPAITQNEEETGGLTKLTGIEYQLVQTIAKQLHVDIDFKTKSTNVFHLFQQLIEGQIEIIVGGIDEDPSISQYVSSSTSYHQDELTWCVAKAKRKHSLFNFLASLDTSAWVLLLLFIITCSLAVLVAQQVSGYHLNSLRNYLSICIRMLGILLTQAINVNAQSLPNALRVLFCMAFLLAFFFSNTYQSFLISTLTTPTTQAQISELEQIYATRMRTMVSSENVRHLSKEGETFRYIRENFEICYNIVDCLNYAADNEQIAVAVSRQHAFYNARIQRDRLYCFDRKESLYVYPVAMLLPKKYHLLHNVNDVIQQVIESGHMQKWARDLDMVRMIQEKIARVQEDAFKALTLDAFQGAFAFASVLLLFASTVFVLECLVFLLVVKFRTRLRLLRWLHRRFGRS